MREKERDRELTEWKREKDEIQKGIEKERKSDKERDRHLEGITPETKFKRLYFQICSEGAMYD